MPTWEMVLLLRIAIWMLLLLSLLYMRLAVLCAGCLKMALVSPRRTQRGRVCERTRPF